MMLTLIIGLLSYISLWPLYYLCSNSQISVKNSPPPPSPSPSRGEGREGVISFGCGDAALCALWQRRLFRPRMGPIINLHQFIHANMRVPLGGGQTHMPQQFLDGPQVRPRIQEMSGERMAQGMGAHFSQ